MGDSKGRTSAYTLQGSQCARKRHSITADITLCLCWTLWDASSRSHHNDAVNEWETRDAHYLLWHGLPISNKGIISWVSPGTSADVHIWGLYKGPHLWRVESCRQEAAAQLCNEVRRVRFMPYHFVIWIKSLFVLKRSLQSIWSQSLPWAVNICLTWKLSLTLIAARGDDQHHRQTLARTLTECIDSMTVIVWVAKKPIHHRHPSAFTMWRALIDNDVPYPELQQLQ